MNTLSPDRQLSATEHWHELRGYFLDRILIGFVILALIGLPVSLSRAWFHGWHLVYTIQSIIALVVLLLYVLRHQLSFALKSGVLIFSLLILALMGLKTFGLAGGGVPFLLLLQFLVSSIYPLQTALIWFFSTFAMLVVIGLGCIAGNIQFTIDFNDYMTRLSSWASVWILFGVIGIVAFRAMGVVQHTLLSLLKEIEEQRNYINHLANHDQLTGLPTMRLAQDRLEMAVNHAEYNQGKVAVLLMDLDGFKQINDRFGYEYGDRALKETAQRMRQIVRANDTVARRSGDEFLVILESQGDTQYFSITAERIIREISQPIHHNNMWFTVGASIGIAIFPDHSRNIEELKSLADQAMYDVKNQQKNSFSFAKVSGL